MNEKKITMKYPFDIDNSNFDGLEHNIIPNYLYSFELNGEEYFWLEYYDERLNSDMSTMLTRDNNGNFYKRPLDNYDNIGELLNNVELRDEDISQINNNIGLGEFIVYDELIDNQIEKPREITPNSDIKLESYNSSNIRVFRAPGNSNQYYAVDTVNQSINLFEVKPNGEINRLFVYLNYNSNRDILNYEEVDPSVLGYESNQLSAPRMDWQALFRVYRIGDRLEVERGAYDHYLSQYIGNKNPNRQIGRERVTITQEEIDYIIENSHEPNLKPDYIDELTVSNRERGNGSDGGNDPLNPPENDVTVLFEVFVTDYGMFVSRRTYDYYLEQYIGDKNPDRHIGDDRVTITQEEIDYIVRVSRKPHLEPDYKYELTRDANNGFGNNGDNPNIKDNSGIVMDYPNMNDYPGLPFNRLWDGQTHSIKPQELFRFELSGRVFYFMNYYDNNYHCNCITLLGENELGQIVKIPLDNYDRLEQLLSRVNLERVNINILPHHIHLGKLLEIDYLIGLCKGLGDIPPYTPNNNATSKDNSINNVKTKKFDGKQALFTVFRDIDGTLRVDAVEYDFYLNELLDKETHPVVKGKVKLTEEDLKTIYHNSKNPELMPDFEIEYWSFDEDKILNTDKFNVYISDYNLEIDATYYYRFNDLGLLSEREVINNRVQITKEEINNIEEYKGEKEYYAKLINEIPLKPEVAFTTYNVNGEQFEVTQNIYERYLEKYIGNNVPQRHAGWNEMGDHFVIITEDDLKIIERESINPKLTPTILYKERKKRDIYTGEPVDENTNTETKEIDNNQPIPDNPPIKKRSKVKQVIKNTKDWAKKHPVLATIGIGLSILLASQLALSGVMMLNSTLWHVLGGTGAACSKLHTINLALSKVVGLGAFKFTEAGTYALAGKTGALALYSGVGAKLTTAVLGLTGIGGLGKLIANKIKKRKDKKEEKDAPTKNNNNENVNLTREQIAELIKQEVEKVTRDKDATIEKLMNENQELRNQLEESLGRTK